LNSLRARNIVPADIQHLETDVFALFIAVEPEDHEVHAFGDVVEVVGDRAGMFIQLSEGWRVKKPLWILLPVLVLDGEVTVENVSRH